jgi:unspecific monooxygenase
MTTASSRAVSTPPGPTGLPLLGNQPAFERNPLAFLLQQPKYGDLVRFSGKKYRVNSPALVEEVFKRTNSAYVIDTDLLRREADGARESAELHRWMRARSVAGRGLNRSSLRAAEDRVAGTVARHAQKWSAQGTIEMVPAMEDLTANLITEYSLGPDTGPVALTWWPCCRTRCCPQASAT